MWNALRDFIIRLFEPRTKQTISQAEFIHYLQIEIEKLHKENSRLIELLVTPKSVPEDNIRIEDLQPIGNKKKPWSQVRAELEADSIKKYEARRASPEQAASIADLEKELGVS